MMYASDDMCAEAKVQKQTRPDQGRRGAGWALQ